MSAGLSVTDAVALLETIKTALYRADVAVSQAKTTANELAERWFAELEKLEEGGTEIDFACRYCSIFNRDFRALDEKAPHRFVGQLEEAIGDAEDWLEHVADELSS